MREKITQNQLIVQLYEKAEQMILTEQQKEALDMLKCIQTYRTCPSVEMLLKNKPQLVHQLDEIYKLWKKFQKMSEQELSELAMELVREI